MEGMITEGLAHAYGNLTAMLGRFLPRVIIMLAIILFGCLIAYVVKIALRTVLRFTNFDKLSERSGAKQFLSQAELPSAADLLSRFVFWVIWIGFILIGIDELGIQSLHAQITRIFAELPQIFIAIVIVLVGLAAANFFSRAALLAAVNAGLPSPQLWKHMTRLVIGLLAVSVALEQIGLGRQTILAAFTIIFGSVMLGLAISFGLAGRHLARKVLERQLTHPRAEKERDDEPPPL